MSGPPPAAQGHAGPLGVAAIVSNAVGTFGAMARAPVHSSFWAKAGEATTTAARRKGVFFIGERMGEIEGEAAESATGRCCEDNRLSFLQCPLHPTSGTPRARVRSHCLPSRSLHRLGNPLRPPSQRPARRTSIRSHCAGTSKRPPGAAPTCDGLRGRRAGREDDLETVGGVRAEAEGIPTPRPRAARLTGQRRGRSGAVRNVSPAEGER